MSVYFLPIFWKEPGKTRGWNKKYFGNLLWNLLSVSNTVVNETLLGQAQSPIARNFPGFSYLLTVLCDISAVAVI